MQDKEPVNDKGERHGLWEVYYSNGQLQWRGLYLNGAKFGKHEGYYYDGRLLYMRNYINGENYGYYQFNWYDGKIDKEYYAR